MMKKIVIALIAVVFTIGTMMAQKNESSITNKGDDNTLRVDQTYQGNGNKNQSSIDIQEYADLNGLEVRQMGHNNRSNATLEEKSDENDGIVKQWGDHNDSQLKIKGDDNTIRLLQESDGNVSDINVIGYSDRNFVEVNQKQGGDHGSWVKIDGESDQNTLHVNQHGKYNWSKVELLDDSNNNFIDVHQTQDDSKSYIKLYNSSNGNEIYVDQKGN